MVVVWQGLVCKTLVSMERRFSGLFWVLSLFFSLAISAVGGHVSAQDAAIRGGKAPVLAKRLDPFSCISSAPSLSQSEGRAILEKVQVHYAAIESMQGSFRQDSYVAALDEGEASSGLMVFAKPGKMRWSYKVPREQEVVIRDGELWMYQPDKGQVMIDSVGAVLLSALPVSFMMGIGNVTKDFDLVSACRAQGGIALNLVPHKGAGQSGKEEALEGFVLLVDQQKNVPQGAKISSVGGNVTAIVFENLQLNVPEVNSNRFVLEYPKGVDILDRRTAPGS
jgi:outer membrane lipoprotein carrier protein